MLLNQRGRTPSSDFWCDKMYLHYSKCQIISSKANRFFLGYFRGGKTLNTWVYTKIKTIKTYYIRSS